MDDIDALILCGGKGTRLAGVLPNGLPKCLADINGRPFVEILIEHLRGSGFDKLMFLGGCGWRTLDDYLTRKHLGDSRENIRLYIEHRLRGTAGAIKCARGDRGEPFFIFNGDTLCDVDYGAMRAYHEATNSTITVACDQQFRHVGTFLASRRFVDLIPGVYGRMDMAEVFTLLGQRHEPVGWFMTGAPFYDIGTPEGLGEFRRLWR